MNHTTLELGRNNAGRLAIVATDWEHGYGVRSYLLSMQEPGTADRIMRKRYNDMLRLMAGNVQAGGGDDE